MLTNGSDVNNIFPIFQNSAVLKTFAVAAHLEQKHALLEVMPLHRGRRVQTAERRLRVDHERVVVAAMVDVVTQPSNEQGEPLRRNI